MVEKERVILPWWRQWVESPAKQLGCVWTMAEQWRCVATTPSTAQDFPFIFLPFPVSVFLVVVWCVQQCRLPRHLWLPVSVRFFFLGLGLSSCCLSSSPGRFTDMHGIQWTKRTRNQTKPLLVLDLEMSLIGQTLGWNIKDQSIDDCKIEPNESICCIYQTDLTMLELH